MGFFLPICYALAHSFIPLYFFNMAENHSRFLSLAKIKQYLIGSLLIFLFLAAGHFLSSFIPLPAPVIGLLVCAIACAVLGEVPTSLLLVSQLLLSNMALFFIPLIVSATLYLDLIKNNWLEVSLSLLISTLVAMAVTAKLADKNLKANNSE